MKLYISKAMNGLLGSVFYFIGVSPTISSNMLLSNVLSATREASLANAMRSMGLPWM
jgi:hypothetical protein